MATNLNKKYHQFISEGGSLGHVVQEIIDRIQYQDGFFEELNEFIEKYESPFETVIDENGSVRRLKHNFYKTTEDGSSN